MSVAHTPCSRNRKPRLALPLGAGALPPQSAGHLCRRHPRSCRCHLARPCPGCGSLPATKEEHPPSTATPKGNSLLSLCHAGKTPPEPLFFFFFLNSLSFYTCFVRACVGARIEGYVVTRESHFSPSTVRVPSIDLRSPGLATNVFTC